MSNGRNPIMPDVSPRPRADHSSHQIATCIGVLLIIFIIYALTICALDGAHDRELKEATASAKAQEQEARLAIEKVTKHESELKSREQTLKREKEELEARLLSLENKKQDLEKREEELSTKLAELETERTNFTVNLLRISNLCKQLENELSIAFPIEEIEEFIDLDE